MSQKVHARFRLSEDARASYWQDGGYVPAARIKMSAVKGEPFGSSTPQGNVEMFIVNPEAIDVFRDVELGQEFDVIFTPVSPVTRG